MTTLIAETELPTGTWTFDPHHTNIAFVARHLMVTKVRGRFPSFDGTVNVEDPLIKSGLAVTIDAGSITTDARDRDQHLVSADFLDVANYPQIRFESTSIAKEKGQWRLTGDLTIKDVTRPVTLAVEFGGIETNPWGKTVAAFYAETEIDREDWGLTWNVALESGGWLVSKKVTIEIEAQLVRT